MARRAAGAAYPGRKLAFAGLVALIAAPAGAQDYSACAKIENPFAYNQCLANHGPPAHATVAIAPPAGADQGAAAWRRPASQSRAGGTMPFSRRRNGRMTAEFTVVDKPGPVGSPRRGQTP